MHDRLHYALKRLGEETISLREFNEFMREHKLTQDHIDDYCRHHHAGTLKLTVEKAKHK